MSRALPENRVGIRGLDALTGVTLGTRYRLFTRTRDANRNCNCRKKGTYSLYVCFRQRENDTTVRTKGNDCQRCPSCSQHYRLANYMECPDSACQISVNGNDITNTRRHGTPSTVLLNGKVS